MKQPDEVQIPEIVSPRPHARGWFDAYKRFLLSRHEPLMLKLAPLALLGYLPINILDEFIPVIGFLDDIPYVILWGYVIFATMRRLHRYR